MRVNDDRILNIEVKYDQKIKYDFEHNFWTRNDFSKSKNHILKQGWRNIYMVLSQT